MRHFLLFFLLLSANALLLSQNKSQETIAALERQRFEAMTHKDIAFLQGVLTGDVTYSHSNGLVETKEEHLENIKSGRIVYEEMELEESKVRMYRKTAIVNGVVRVKGLYKNAPFNIRLGYTDVYVKQKRKWKLAAWQSVKL